MLRRLHPPHAAPISAFALCGKSDLLFLKDSLKRGMPIAEVARFLGWDEDDVRRKAKEMDKKMDKAEKRVKRQP